MEHCVLSGVKSVTYLGYNRPLITDISGRSSEVSGNEVLPYLCAILSKLNVRYYVIHDTYNKPFTFHD